MIVFFSSCELVEFHYHLFLQTLPSRLGALASGQPPSASTRLKFLRLHGNMKQEVSSARGPESRGGSRPEAQEQECVLGGRRRPPSRTPPGWAGMRLRWARRRPWKQTPRLGGLGKGVHCSRVLVLRELPSST